ncbi:MAG: ABC transporter permease [Firmicutes bacterium]|jgi:simple sugar transport system permease protein|nr:ABC transporter permease [Bacillota bacterium]
MDEVMLAQIGQVLKRYVFNLANLQGMLRLSTPVILSGLSALITSRAGIMNIAAEGMINLCTFAAVAGSYFLGHAIGGVGVALLTGLLVGGFFALFSIKFRANTTVMGIAINITSVSVTMFLCRAIFKQAGAFSDPSIMGLSPIHIPVIEKIPILGPLVSGYSIITYLAWALIPITTIFLYRTRTGWHLRAVGENPQAAETLGINVDRMKFGAMMASGVFAALAALYLSLAHLQMYTDEMAAGRGFIGMSVNTFGGGEPAGVFLSSLLFGFVDTIGWRLQADRIMPPQFITMLPYVATLVFLTVFTVRKNRRLKAALEKAAREDVQERQSTAASA